MNPAAACAALSMVETSMLYTSINRFCPSIAITYGTCDASTFSANLNCTTSYIALETRPVGDTVVTFGTGWVSPPSTGVGAGATPPAAGLVCSTYVPGGGGIVSFR